MRQWIGVLLAATLLAAPQREKEEVTQKLDVPPEPPSVVKVETSRLTFQVSSLTTKGLLSQQVKDAVNNIWKNNDKGTVVKLRALVAGTGDMRRVQAIVGEAFSDKRRPIPVLTVVQVGMLPRDGAQVVLEAITEARKPVNPHGLAFISGQIASMPIDPTKPVMPITPLVVKSMAGIRTAVTKAGSTSQDVQRVTCFTSGIEDYFDMHRLLSTEFPHAALNIVQVQRAPNQAMAECEAVARLRTPPAEPLSFINPPELESADYSQVALVNSPRLALSSAQLAFRFQDSDVRLAFDRLKGSLDGSGVSIRDVAVSSVYPLNAAIAERIKELRFEFYNKSQPPAGTIMPFQGLPSLDASFAVDVVAVVRGSEAGSSR